MIPFKKAELNEIINSNTATQAEKDDAKLELKAIEDDEKRQAKIKSDAETAEKD